MLWLARRLGLGAGRRARRGARLPAHAVRAAVRLAHVGDAAAVGRARLDRRADGPRRHPVAVAPRRPRRARRGDGRRGQRDRAADGRSGARAVAARRRVPAARSRGAERPARRCASAVLSLGVSLWWIAAVVIQGRRGADVLAYSESLESVSYTSTSPEVWRNLGYWLTYVRDAYAPTTSAGRDYMVSGRLIATGFVLLLIGLAGLVATRWTHRRFAVALVVVGVVLGVGVHPIDDPSPLMDLVLGDGTSGAALALRSSTRAVPMLVLGIALGVAALVDACGALRLRQPRAVGPDPHRARRRPRRRQPARAHRTALGRPGDRPRPGPAGGVGRRRRRARRRRHPGARAAAAGPGVRRLPLGLHRRPAAARHDGQAARHPRPPAARQRRGDGPALRPRRPLPERHRRARRDRTGRPPARCRHDLDHRRRRLRPLPHGPPRDRRAICSPPACPAPAPASAVRRARWPTCPTSR